MAGGVYHSGEGSGQREIRQYLSEKADQDRRQGVICLRVCNSVWIISFFHQWGKGGRRRNGSWMDLVPQAPVLSDLRCDKPSKRGRKQAGRHAGGRLV